MSKVLIFLPLAIFGALGGLMLAGLQREDRDSTNPSVPPSVFVGAEVPEVVSAPLSPYPSFDTALLQEDGVKLVNFWASWCPPCRAEHPALEELAAEGIPIYGVNIKDQDAEAVSFLEELGNPYAGITVDPRGRQAIDWGVVAPPETFIIDGDGVIRFVFKGPIHRVMDTVIRPELAAAAE
ncbi:DsbE family thiol:disulfide interchange protein [Aestuariibius sp. 2305UL40-4]|uniref:DsbE family thiol:disulfide interchange protein n=1 Tax=Aestuariibius violaceus TaxID=3234132 RepID=UPI00345E0CCE